MQAAGRILAGLLFLAAAFPAFAQIDSTQTRTLSGSVRVTGERLPDNRVRVRLYGATGAIVDEVYSDSSGSYQFRALRPGIYRLEFQAEGYATVSQSVEILSFVPITTVPPVILTTPPEGPKSSPGGIVDAGEFQIPKEAREEFQRGQSAAAKSNHSEARKHYSRAIKLHPTYAQAYQGLGVSLALLGKFVEAEKALERAIELNPRIPESYLGLGKVFNSTNRPGPAKTALLRGIEFAPDSGEFLVELSRAEYTLGEFQEAERHASSALRLLPNPPSQVHLILANCYLKLGRLLEAERSLSAFLKADPDSPSAPKAREVLAKLHRAGVKPPQ